MLSSLDDMVDIDVDKWGPKLLSQWLWKESAAGLMTYLWELYTEDRTLGEFGLDSSEDAVRFLAIAKAATQALAIADGDNGESAWNGMDIHTHSAPTVGVPRVGWHCRMGYIRP